MEEKKFWEVSAALGNRIRSVRKAKEMSQLDIEVHSGVSREEVSRIENGLKNIELFTIIKIADALGMDFWELMQLQKNNS